MLVCCLNELSCRLSFLELVSARHLRQRTLLWSRHNRFFARAQAVRLYLHTLSILTSGSGDCFRCLIFPRATLLAHTLLIILTSACHYSSTAIFKQQARPSIMFALPSLRAASGSTFRTSAPARYNSTQAGSGSNASYGSATRSTVPPRSTHATYHPDGYGISEGLKRARKPYRMRNILTGSLIMGFATSVYFYSISKVRTCVASLGSAISILTQHYSLFICIDAVQVKQDDFSDLAEIRAPAATDSTPVTTEADHKHKV